MQPNDFVRSYLDAWNNSDAIAIASHLQKNGTYLDIPEKIMWTHDQLIISLKEFFKKHRHKYEIIGEVLNGKNTIAFEYQVLQEKKNNSDLKINGAEFITLSENGATNITDYYEIISIDKPIKTSSSQPFKYLKYEKSGLNQNLLIKYKSKLEDLMEKETLYLTPDLNLPKLAKTIGCSPNHLSQVINSGFGKSFYDFLNQYRIEHARNLLLKNDNHAIVNIAFAVGFNSNSAFYSAFKKYLGYTPAEYRKILKKIKYKLNK